VKLSYSKTDLINKCSDYKLFFYAVHFKLHGLCTTIITINNFLINLCHREYKKCPVLARMQAWIRLHQWLCNGIVHSSPHRQSDAASNRSHPALLSGNSLLQYAADVVNWIQVMAIQRPQIWGDERMVVGFTQLFLMMSLQTLQTIIRANAFVILLNSFGT